ncbi:MAG: GH92 family glycosyl hydrolase [Abditibacteriota bacterium]|nr:GH92 family glycosyl hydrolase [Abditibacteriota bacterium]
MKYLLSLLSVCALAALAAGPLCAFGTSFESGDPALPGHRVLRADNVLQDGGFGFEDLLQSFSGTPAIDDTWSVANATDNDVETKYITRVLPTEIICELKKPARAEGVSISSGNDFPGRDPSAWTLEGSFDGRDYHLIDSRSGLAFTDRNQTQEWDFAPTPAYRYYRLTITDKRNDPPEPLMQIGGFALRLLPDETEVIPPGLITEIVGGPAHPWINFPLRGWTGERCLMVRGLHKDPGPARAESVICKDLNCQVGADTCFSFMIFPDFCGEYDFGHVSQYVSLDLVFTDNTRLSELGARDRDGFLMGAPGQGAARRLITNQWNYICCDLSPYAAGKTVRDVVVCYENDVPGGNSYLLSYFDDVYIGPRTPAAKTEPADYVLTTRGTNDNVTFSRGLNFPAACLPGGFNYWTPATSGTGSRIYSYQPGHRLCHFQSSHQPSAHTGDYGVFAVMPSCRVTAENASLANTSPEARSSDFDHSSETARAHYYGVTLKDGNVRAEMTPADHAAVMRFTFREPGSRSLIFDAGCTGEGNGSIRLTGRTLTFLSDVKWFMNDGAPMTYFYGSLSETPVAVRYLSAGRPLAVAEFDRSVETVELRVASSYVSFEQARANLAEVEDRSFEAVRNSAKRRWNALLGALVPEGATEEELTTLYSCLYRLYMYPQSFTENVDGRDCFVAPYGSRTRLMPGRLYTNYGFWDAYRTQFPAYYLLTPGLASDYLEGTLSHYRASGWISRWLCPGAFFCMPGTQSDAVFGDAAAKGIAFDKETAFEAGWKNVSAISDREGTFGRTENSVYPYKQGWHPSYCFGAENSIGNYALSVLAEQLGDRDKAAFLRETSSGLETQYDPEVGFFVSGHDGVWKYTPENFDPFLWHGDYAETNAWESAFMAVHDGQGLVNLFGGRDRLEEKLDDMLAAPERYVYPVTQHEMLEAREVRMGQYQHNNSPAHNALYMYAFTDAKHKTQKYVREVLRRLYLGSEIGQGYLGDEDNGEQSAWYALSAMGFYPLAPGTGEYVITSPLFDKITLRRDTGDLTIRAVNNAPENCYIKALTVDGKPWDRITIDHSELMAAKDICFTLTGEPTDWAKGTWPASLSKPGRQSYGLRDLIVRVSAEGEDIGELCDDTSLTGRVFGTRKAAVTIETDGSEQPGLLTLTCGKKERAPVSFALYGSEDGNSWEPLRAEKAIAFKWDRSLLPFLIPGDKGYRYYRLELASLGPLELTELQLCPITK